MPAGYTPIDGTLNFQPGGNPLAGMAGGLPGLAANYQADYNSYLNTNQQLYNQITKGYGTVMSNVANTLGQGGTDWGVAQGAANDINRRGNQAAGGSIQNSINSGLGKSTAAVAAQRGVNSDTQMALGQLGNSLANTYAGYESNIGQNQLNFMNSVTAPPPNAAAYSALFQQYGQTQQQAANLAMQQQALDQQRRASSQAAARSAGGGGGGVSIPQMPRGGTYGSGSSGFPSGGGVNPSAFGSNPFDPYAFLNKGSNGAVGIGGQSVTPGGGGYDPWSYGPGSDAGSNAYDAGSAAGAAIGAGFGDMSGQFGFSGMASPWDG